MRHNIQSRIASKSIFSRKISFATAAYAACFIAVSAAVKPAIGINFQRKILSAGRNYQTSNLGFRSLVLNTRGGGSGFRQYREYNSNTATRMTSDVNTDENEPRTGWLHNTEPKWVIEERTKQEASLLSSSFLKGRYSSANHRIVGPPSFHASGEGRLVVVTEHLLSVPLSREMELENKVEVPLIDVSFKIAEVVDSKSEEFFKKDIMVKGPPEERALAYVRHANLKNMDDAIIYLQGGPGFGSPTPAVGIGLSAKSSWLGEAFSKGFKRVVLMDQRGTGSSTTITKQTLERRFPDLFALDKIAATGIAGELVSSIDQLRDTYPNEVINTNASLIEATKFMSNFRADNICIDAEAIREALLVPLADKDPRPWGAVLGQSYGGFCILTYLSTVPSPPKICLLTGGIAPVLWHVDDVYDSLWGKVKERNLQYYDHYPSDIKLVKRIVRVLLKNPVELPSGGLLTARRFLQLGLGLGGSPSAFASLHSLLSSSFLDDECNIFSKSFLKAVDTWQPFDDHPIYFLMHESIYANGGMKYKDNSSPPIPTAWSAHRMYEKRVQTPSEFSYELTANLDTDSRPTLFFGEMVFPWMADGDYAECSGLGMKLLANELANKSDWGPLYDTNQIRSALSTSSKAAAAVYFDDLYVDFGACLDVAKRGGPFEMCKIWITNEYQHSGLRDDGANIFSKLISMAKGEVRIPS